MSRSLADLAREAVELPQQQRLTLARILLDASDSASEPLPEVEAAWEDEITERIRVIDAGEIKGKSWDAVLQDINKRFAW